MANTRELSQLASLVNVNDETKSISILSNQSDAKLGIGTENPISRVDVSGDVNVSGAITASSFYGDGSNLSGLSTFSGNYNDLTNTPSIPSIVGLASEGYVDAAVSGVSTFSGDYNDLTNKPTNLSSFSNDVGFVTSSVVVGLASEGYVNNLVAISTFSGDYNDLINQPSIPSIVGLASEGYVNNLVAISTFSGDYNDLINQPSIPSIVGLASEGYVDTSIANLIDTAPSTLDTLNELAAALGDDPNFATTVTNSLSTKATISYVDNLVAISTAGLVSSEGLVIATAEGIVGSGVTFIDLRGAGISAVTVSSGIATINVEGGGGGGGGGGTINLINYIIN